MKKKARLKVRNFVQAYVQQFCKPQVFESRFEKEKHGYRKHKVSYVALSEQNFISLLGC